MRTRIALLIFSLFILFLFYKDSRQRRLKVSASLWIVLIWTLSIASRPISSWFAYTGSGDAVMDYDAGNPIERLVNFVYIGAGLVVLSRRRIKWSMVVAHNQWLFVFYFYWCASLLWADSPLIAFKRLFKDFGNVVMALIILTEDDPIEAAKTIFDRCAYLLIPLSVLLVRYYGDLGRRYHSSTGELMIIGVCSHKNSLGMLLLVCGMFLLWDLLARGPELMRTDRIGLMLRLTLMLMIAWLVRLGNSATSNFCIYIGVCFLLAFRFRGVKNDFRRTEAWIIAGALLFLLLDMAFNIREVFIQGVMQILGRESTLTGRTDAWKVLLDKGTEISPWLGAGFNSFWTGDRMRQLWASYAIIQAHNGYVETYINGGIAGVALLVAFLSSSYWKIRKKLLAGDVYASLRFTFLLIALMHNYSEASFNKISILWFVLLLVSIEYPPTLRLASRRKLDQNDRDVELSEPTNCPAF